MQGDSHSGVIPSGRVGSSDPVGGKARALSLLTAAEFPVPPWFVVTPKVYEDGMTDAHRAAIASQLDTLGDGLFAVRSSALEEDSARHSFAGQLESFLFVRAEDVPARIADVWRSGFSERVLAYCAEHRIARPTTAPAVLVQRMVDADVSGVAFSVDPVKGDRSRAVVVAVYGLGTALVDGSADADTYHVDKSGAVVERAIARKVTAHRRSAATIAGVAAVAVDDARATAPALDDPNIVAVAALARAAESFFGRPQDIEWAIENGRLFLLQSRPITSLFDLPEAAGALNIWDNSNIAESYGGTTTPLTFSFARNAYEGVYRQLCQTFGVPRARIEENTALFANMLGLVRGRVYYNLLNWYRFLALLPGYKANRGFMEQMMGVKESLPEGALAPAPPVPWHARVADGVRFAGTAIGFGSQHFTLPRKMKAFYARLEDALAPRDLAAMRADELVAYYRYLESRLLSRWDAPLINDFYTMIFYGVLRKLCASWCGDGNATLQNDLLCGSGGMVSTEPADRVLAMADIARRDPALVETLCTGSLEQITRALENNPELRERYQSYLQKFGERCLDELKLESPTLHDDPSMLLRSVGNLARGERAHLPPHGTLPAARVRGEAEASRALAKHPVRRVVFRWVLDNARARVRGRENMRLERTRLFGRVRRIMVELGRRFHERDLLDDPRDVFYLHLDEVLGFVEGTAVSTRLRDLAAVRREEFARYAALDPPPSRFETRGMVYVGNPLRPRAASAGSALDTRSGIGCCPGLVTARARVVRDPRQAVIERGCILVAERTDPGWIMLFPMAAGLLVERGSLLSHSAIVAREMGIPAIVSIEGLLGWINDGEWVELDGATGVVRKVSAPAQAAGGERGA